LPSVSSAGHAGKVLAFADLLALPDPPDAAELDHSQFNAVRAPSFPNPLDVQEGEVVETEGWIHLIALEADGDYHIQMTASATDGNQNLIVEVPCGQEGFVGSKSLRKRFEDVRAFIREKMLKGKEPGSGGNVMNSPPYVHLRGQWFYDAPHFGGNPRGKRGMKAATIWEIHPVVAMWFVAPPG
jgi:hypothetical protein